jgi:hypothetical protein
MFQTSTQSRSYILPTLLLATSATALFQTGSSPAIQDPLINPPPTTCPVVQDGATSNTFPWTHIPLCVDAVLPSPEGDSHQGIHRDFCVYTNAAFNNGRGLSLVTTPETAAELTFDVFSPYFDDTPNFDPPWEVKEAKGKGQGVFATRSIAAGDTLILKSPMLFVNKEVLVTPNRARRNLLLRTAVEQLPEKSRNLIMGLSTGWRGGEEDVGDVQEELIGDLVSVNAVRVRVWDGVGHLAVVPEAAVSAALSNRVRFLYALESGNCVHDSRKSRITWSWVVTPKWFPSGMSNELIVTQRINHACRPNAYYRFNDYTLNFDVFALRDVQPGDELTFSCKCSPLLLNPSLTSLDGFSQLAHDERRLALEAHWGFPCTCALCTANATTIQTSNFRLQKISQIKAALPSGTDALPQLLGLLPELISLMEEEGLLVELPMYEEILAYTWSAFGIEQRAREWASRARKGWEVVAGRESWEARRLKELEGDVRTHYTWMSWEGEDPWEGVGMGHPWDREEDHDHDHDHDHDGHEH